MCVRVYSWARACVQVRARCMCAFVSIFRRMTVCMCVRVRARMCGCRRAHVCAVGEGVCCARVCAPPHTPQTDHTPQTYSHTHTHTHLNVYIFHEKVILDQGEIREGWGSLTCSSPSHTHTLLSRSPLTHAPAAQPLRYPYPFTHSRTHPLTRSVTRLHPPASHTHARTHNIHTHTSSSTSITRIRTHSQHTHASTRTRTRTHTQNTTHTHTHTHTHTNPLIATTIKWLLVSNRESKFHSCE